MISGSWLVMSQGPQPGQTFMLDRDWLTVGRDPSNEIVISDPQVSRQHARITRQGKLVVIEDLGSTNGTFVNGMRLTGPHVMANGDVIGLGDAVTLTYYEVGIAAGETTETVVGRAAAMPMPPPAYAPHAMVQPPVPPAHAASAIPSPPYVAAPPPPGIPLAAEEKKRRTGLIVGCAIVALLIVVVACLTIVALDYLKMLPPVFYEPLRWLGLIP